MKKRIKLFLLIVCTITIGIFLPFYQKTEVKYGFPEVILKGKEAEKFISLYYSAVKYEDQGYSENRYLNNWRDYLISQKGSDLIVSVYDLNAINVKGVNYYVDPFDEFICYCRQLDDKTDYQQEIAKLLNGEKYVFKQNNNYKICFIVMDGNMTLNEIADLFEDTVGSDQVVGDYANDFNIHILNGGKYNYEVKKIEHTDDYFILKCDGLSVYDIRKNFMWQLG